MQTPFEETRSAECGTRNGEWAARNEKPKRSVFGNYSSSSRREEAQTSFADVANDNQRLFTPAATSQAGLQAAIDTAVARAFLYQFLARAFEDPTVETWNWLCTPATQESVRAAWALVQRRTGVAPVSNISEESSKDGDRRDACPTFSADRFEQFQTAYVTAFGHAARGDCPLNEIEYGDLKADPLFQPHRLADLAAFYRAFGLEVADAAAERPDHIGMELEFMSVLAAKEAYAHEHQLDQDQGALCHVAQKKFLREHLGRWSPAFARHMARAATDAALAALAEFTRDFIAAECSRFGLPAGSEDLRLRPVDEADESLCASCGLQNLPPGAAAPAATT